MKISKFPENLARALKDCRMSQRKLAEKMNTTQQTVSRWIKGINEPDFETFLKICLYLKESPNELLGYDEIPASLLEETEKGAETD